MFFARSLLRLVGSAFPAAQGGALALAVSVTAVADWTLTQHSAPAPSMIARTGRAPSDEYG